MSDQLILVNQTDQPIGQKNKEAAHKEGCLHRAFSVFLYGDFPQGRSMLIQQRHPAKYHSGNLWANACCSHPRWGETLEVAVPRRMEEELGFSCPVEKQFEFIYFTAFSDCLFEYEYDHVFLGKCSDNQTLDLPFNPEEIAQLRWVPLAELKTWMLTQPQDFSTWFHVAAPRIIQTLEED